MCQAIGYDAARDKLGVNSTGLPFDSVMAVELNAHRTMNPMVNAGAIAATSLMPGDTAEAKCDAVREGLVYLPFIVLVAQRYKKDAGIGTIISLMIPYTFIVLIAGMAFVRRLVLARDTDGPRLSRQALTSSSSSVDVGACCFSSTASP